MDVTVLAESIKETRSISLKCKASQINRAASFHCDMIYYILLTINSPYHTTDE